MEKTFRAYHLLGNIAVINFSKGILLKDKKKFANNHKG